MSNRVNQRVAQGSYVVLMHLSITVVNILRATRGDSHVLFAPSFRFSQKGFAQGGGGVRSSQIFPEIDKNLQCISIFSQRVQETIKNGRKSSCFLSQ